MHIAPKQYQMIAKLVALGVVMILSSGCSQTSLQSTAATPSLTIRGTAVSQDVYNVQHMLLASPEACQTPCFWTIDVAHTTYEDFEKILVEIYVSQKTTIPTNAPLKGIHGQISFAALPAIHSTDNTVGHIELMVYPAEARQIYELDQISLAAVTNMYGSPDNAQIQRFPGSPTFVMYLVYEERAFIYELRGTVQQQKICLNLDSAEYVALSRFRDADTAIGYVDFQTTSLPAQSLTEQILEGLSELPKVAASLDNPCLTLLW